MAVVKIPRDTQQLVDEKGNITRPWRQYLISFQSDSVESSPNINALSVFNSTGYIVYTGSNTFAGRTIGGTAPITVTNGTGVSGNTTIALSTSGVSTGTYGTASSIPTITVDTYGRITSASNTSVQITESQVTNLVSDLAGKQASNANLTAISSYNTTGYVVYTGSNTFVGRTITGTANSITVTNGDGAAGNTTLAISATYPGQTSITTLGTVTTGTWNGTKTGLAYGGTNADLSATGGASQVLKQTSSGAAITVGQLAASDLSNGTTGSGSVVLATSPTITTPGIVGVTNAGNATAGNVGEYNSSATGGAAVSAGTSGQFGNITSISLTAGDWDVSGTFIPIINGAVITSGTWDVNLSAFSGNTTTDLVVGDNYLTISHLTNVGSMSIPAWRVNVSSTTTIYLKGRVSYSSGTPQWYGRISARRVR